MLAEGDLSQTEIAEIMGVTPQAISYVAREHADKIAAQKANMENEFAALWIADKKNRVAEYEADVEHINAHLPNTTAPDPQLLLRKHQALRLAAEERGHLTQHLKMDATEKVHYTVEGVDLGDV